MAHKFWLSIISSGPSRWYNATNNRQWDLGVVYAAMGKSSLQKASASALSVHAAYVRRDFGLLVVTSDVGIDTLHAQGSAFDMAASLDGHGISFAKVPEFYAFTSLENVSPAQKNSVNEKKKNWRWLRLLRSAKIIALAIALRVFSQGAIFLDADTQICGPILKKIMAPILDSRRATLAFVPASRLHHGIAIERRFGLSIRAKPPEPNTGVLAIGPAFFSVLETWMQMYWIESAQLESKQNPMDQPSLRLALASNFSNITYFTLPSSMNCRGHVRNLRLPLPLRCGGFSKAAHSAVIHNLQQMSKKKQQSVAAPTELSKALSLQGGTGCDIVHSHSLPWPRPLSNTNQSSHICHGKGLSKHSSIVLIDASASRGVACDSDRQRISELLTGPYALERARKSQIPIAIILLLGRPPTATSFIDLLSPLWLQDLRHTEPRSLRRRRLGSPTLADAADIIHRLDQEVALIILDEEPELSLNFVRLAFPDRPNILSAIKSHLTCTRSRRPHSMHQQRDEILLDDFSTDIHFDTMIYEAGFRLFETQRHCLF
eukprot:CAMPEP_0197321602 /NCGR_PEP_ID=MMETSP0891-20130614/65474_1 /TAXON_ID=44058 ORGANISM="Aureoumbra lagunensis, Strain CCMP1510" /NCGR_SAMPLE_ID=MMETSP0891 /ASSEMBLY_ACC=CAM_ASM_000534 /LENGTH=545 /DNA_ID=CAMNT_0042813559 /DNA_START=15 /DNA_END=1652 /DNA_ORIENTATION=+